MIYLFLICVPVRCSFWQCWYQHAVRIFCISNTLDVCQFQIVWSALIKGQQHEIFSIKNCLFFLSLAYQNDYFVCALYIQFLSNLNNIQSTFLKGQHHEILWKHLGITQLSLVFLLKRQHHEILLINFPILFFKNCLFWGLFLDVHFPKLLI